jgi:two-component system osmolarity sensor histidine kinase EnvZ
VPPAPAPRTWSLVRRLTGGVALIALLSFGVQALVLVMWIQPVADDVAGIAAEQVLQVQAALGAVASAQRDALAAKLSAGPVDVSRKPPPDAPTLRDAPPAPREFENFAKPLVGPAIEVRIEARPHDGFAAVFRLPVDDEVWWLTREYSGAQGAVSGTLAVWLVLLGAVTLGALLVSVRLIARPIGELAAQISRQRGLLRALPEPGDASVELRALVQAFNRLAHQVTAAGQARQQLLAGVSHDLRTPLARLRLRVETQCEPPVADALTADLFALERIVDQFLAYVQGDGNPALGEPEPLAESVRDAVRRYEAAGDPVQLHLDPVALQAPDLAVQRLLTNLIDNALAYGRAPVEVALHATDEGAELRVMDGGPGMSEEDFERAQQPFVRLTRTRSELGHCGLGLAIVAQIAQQLGGRLRAVRDAEGRFGIALALPAQGAA